MIRSRSALVGMTVGQMPDHGDHRITRSPDFISLHQLADPSHRVVINPTAVIDWAVAVEDATVNGLR
jgi:hypothetical protein